VFVTPDQKQLVQGSWALVKPIEAQAAAIFYDTLFELDPSIKALFKGDIDEQGKKLMTMIGAAVNMLNRLDELVPVVKRLGERHATYNVTPEHYPIVGTALLRTLETGLGEAFTPAVREAWSAVYGVLSDTMIQAASDSTGAGAGKA